MVIMWLNKRSNNLILEKKLDLDIYLKIVIDFSQEQDS